MSKIVDPPIAMFRRVMLRSWGLKLANDMRSHPGRLTKPSLAAGAGGVKHLEPRRQPHDDLSDCRRFSAVVT
jgi:hypothetical protein